MSVFIVHSILDQLLIWRVSDTHLFYGESFGTAMTPHVAETFLYSSSDFPSSDSPDILPPMPTWSDKNANFIQQIKLRTQEKLTCSSSSSSPETSAFSASAFSISLARSASSVAVTTLGAFLTVKVPPAASILALTASQASSNSLRPAAFSGVDVVRT